MNHKTPLILLLCCTGVCYSYTFSTRLMASFLKNKLYDIIDESLSETQCAADLKTFISDLSDLKLWALKMLDANGKLQPGVLNGNIYQTGNFDECLDISAPIRGSNIEGQYCSVMVLPDNTTPSKFASLFNVEKMVKRMSKKIDNNFPKPVKRQKITLGLCIPKSCTTGLLKNVWNYTKSIFEIPLSLEFKDTLCDFKDKPVEVYPIDYYVFFFFGCVAILVIVSTLYDVFLRCINQKENVFVSFSLYTNSLSLFSTKCENSTLQCLYGMKVISMAWVVLSHIVAFKAHAPTVNAMEIILEWRHRPENSFFLAAHLAVDTFLTISGLLVTYLQLKYSEKYKIKLAPYYAYRIMRLTPALVAVVLFHISVPKYLASGPFSHNYVKALSDPCIRHWWTTLFFINNFDTFDDQCVSQSWYLAVDTQLYFLTPLIIYGLKKWPKKVITAILGSCLVSFIYTLTVVAVNKYGFILFFETEIGFDINVYFSVISRMPAYLIGVLLGYVFYRVQYEPVKLTKRSALVMMASSLTTMLALILYHVEFMNNDYSVLRSAVFNTFSKPIWSLAVSVIIFLCGTGHGGIINDFLSHPVFIIVGKLAYCMYLVHLLVIYILLGNQRENYHFSNFENFQDFAGCFLLISLCAMVLSLVFESPSFLLMKRLRSYANKSASDEDVQNLVDCKGD